MTQSKKNLKTTPNTNNPKSTKIKQGKYEFREGNLVEIRKQMGLSQGQMAEKLGVPANTLSRWELGKTSPDADYLALFYSIAKEYGISPEFFGLREKYKTFPYSLIVIWDFQTTGAPSYWVDHAHNVIAAELNKRFNGMNPILKAFIHPSQRDAGERLKEIGWRITEGEAEVFTFITEDARSDSGHNPEGSVLVLISNDNGFINLVDELTDWGVHVYVMSTAGYNNKLCEKVGPQYCIQWYPVSYETPKRPINDPQIFTWKFG
jgi:transcriptional regulator with XRE-family HTH domain